MFFTYSVSKMIIAYVTGYLNRFYRCWQKDSSLYSNIHNWALLDSATEILTSADTHFSWFVFTPKCVCGWAGSIGLTEQIWYWPSFDRVHPDKTHETSCYILLQLKLIGTRTNAVLMNPNLYYCGIGTDNFQKRKWEGSHQPQEDKQRNTFSGKS